MNDLPEQSPEPSPTPDPPRVGVLLIHGIGLQRPGDTLLTAGGALHSWLQRWFAAGGFLIAGVGLDDVCLATSSRDSGKSAHARLVLMDNSARRASWLLEESYWADAFYPPTFLELVRWCGRMFVSAPMMYLLPRYAEAWHTMEVNSARRRKTGPDGATTDSAAGIRNRKHDNAVARVYFLLLQLPLVGLVAPIVIAGLALVFVLSLIPLDYFRSLAQSAQRLLSASIGDSYFFVTSPLARAAILTRVEHDIHALADRCDSLVIVAHSQGAAVAYEALLRMSRRGTLPETLASLVTYGSGIQRLRALESACVGPRLWTSLGLVTYAGLALFYTSAIWGATSTFSIGTALGACISALLALGGVLAVAGKRLNQLTTVLPLPWKNLYASHDPVAGGPLRVLIYETAVDGSIPFEQLVMPIGDPDRVKAFEENQREVINRRSVVEDHTAYWQAPDDFVALVADELLSRSSAPLSDDDRFWLDVGRARRRWRCAFLSRCRAMALVAVVAACMSPLVLRQAGVWALSSDVVHAVLRRLPESIRGVPAEAAGALVLIAIGRALQAVASVGWQSWNRHDIEAFFARAEFGQERHAPAFLIVGWTSILLFTGVLAGIDGRFSRVAPITWACVFAAVATFVALVSAARGTGTARRLRALVTERVKQQVDREKTAAAVVS